MHPRDLARRGLRSGELAIVESRRGRVIVPVAASDDIAGGQAFLAMHWGDRFLGGAEGGGVNALTIAAFDPASKQPELKHAAVRVAKAELPWRLVAFGFPIAGTAAAAAERLAALGAGFDFASIALIGRDREGVLLRAAAAAPPAAEALAALDAALGLDHPGVIRYDDGRRGVGRRIEVAGARLRAVRLSGEAAAIAAEGWLREWLVRGEPVDPIRRLLVVPAAAPPAGCPTPARVVCSCLDVTETAIAGALPDAPTLAALQAKLGCGTSCGSCVPELRRLLATRERAAA
jgi:assimilatory nitrate reductase catalytic subunit